MKLLLTSFFVIISGACLTQSLDTNFGDSGRVITDFGKHSGAVGVKVQADSRIVIAGWTIANFAMARYSEHGDLDSSFGKNGLVTTDFNGNDDFCYALDIQSDGKILVAGSTRATGSETDFAIARYNTNGTLDKSFGTNGKSITDLGGNDEISCIAFQSDGKIIVGATKYNNLYSEGDFALGRYDKSGKPDSSFGVNGFAVLNIGGYDIARSIAIQKDDKIILAGGNGDDFALIRYESNGVVDSSFGTNGIATTDLGAVDYASSVLIASDGKILAGGVANVSGDIPKVALAKYDLDGTPENSFGVNGKTILNLSNFWGPPVIKLDASEKIILLSQTHDLHFGLARLSGNGSIDNTFGENGTVVTELPGGSAPYGLALQQDGKIVATGDWMDAGALYSDMITFRFETENTLSVSVVTLHAIQLENSVVIKWETAQETNNKYFSLEHSTNNIFNEIAKVNSQGNSTHEQAYSYKDNSPAEGVNFYRLKQVDNNGKFSYSQIASVKFISAALPELYPNPVKDVLKIKGLDVNKNYQIRIISEKGNLLGLIQLSNASEFSWDVKHLSKGIYYCNILSSDNRLTIKFVKD